MVEIFKALGDETRLRIVNLLLQRDLCVCDIEGILEITQSNASRHLIKLKNSGIISQEKKAQWVFHKLDEGFIRNNELLIRYLKDQANLNVKYLKDIEMLKNYDVTCFKL